MHQQEGARGCFCKYKEELLGYATREFPQNLKNPKSLTIICTFEAKRYHSNFNYYFSVDTSNSLWQPLFELKNKDEWEESFNMSQKRSNLVIKL